MTLRVNDGASLWLDWAVAQSIFKKKIEALVSDLSKPKPIEKSASRPPILGLARGVPTAAPSLKPPLSVLFSPHQQAARLRQISGRQLQSSALQFLGVPNEMSSDANYKGKKKRTRSLLSYFSSTNTTEDANGHGIGSSSIPSFDDNEITPGSGIGDGNREAEDSEMEERVRPRVEAVFYDGVEKLERDPSLRPQIWEYPVSQRDEVRRAYIMLGPMQPKLEKNQYKPVFDGHQFRRFQYAWFKKFPLWLEYSVTTGCAYCFICYLFAEKNKGKGASDVFISAGFSGWKRVNNGKQCAFLNHVGSEPSSHHNNAQRSYYSLMNQAGHVESVFHKHSQEEKKNNQLRLKVSIATTRWLALQGCAFRGNDESSESSNENAPTVCKYISPDIQKEILSIYGSLIQKHIRDEVGDSKFCVILDETCDVAKREQMALVLRFVDVNGELQERFFDLIHVADAKAETLKTHLLEVFSKHSLRVENIRGQGYDGGSNMKGRLNGLQALILRENPYAYYIHCYAHRLQLALVAASTHVIPVGKFFNQLGFIINTVDSSSKRHEELHDSQVRNLNNLFSLGELDSGPGKNQITTLHRAGDTRWSSHLASIRSILEMFDSVSSVLGNIVSDSSSSYRLRIDGDTAHGYLYSFEFVFILWLMKEVLTITDLLCEALQKKQQDLVNAVRLVKSTRQRLQRMRDEGWDKFFNEVITFCGNHGVDVPNMNDIHILRGGRQRHQADQFTNEHFYRVEIFLVTIDTQLQEIDLKFNDKVMDLLTLMLMLLPTCESYPVDISKVCQCVQKYYPDDFTALEIAALENQLEHFLIDISDDDHLRQVETITELSHSLVKTGRHVAYTLIYRLLHLLITLPVSTASAERVFSALKIVKTRLRNKIEDDFLRNALLVNVEKEIARKFSYDDIITCFKNMKSRRADL
ncbi:uncharacterized protein LOC141833211 [Curcuma longa]|uniref:uncharacterized protein LOC141833211 n=1 Tax=Curcuma longa TaxID=136217 RepID=UPI003D9FA60A